MAWREIFDGKICKTRIYNHLPFRISQKFILFSLKRFVESNRERRDQFVNIQDFIAQVIVTSILGPFYSA